MRVVVLHISDIHFVGDGDPIAGRALKVRDALVGKYPSADACFVAVSGDIANTGDPSEYATALKFFTQLRTTILGAAFPQVEVVCIPGNHDCNLRGEVDTRQFILDSLDTFLKKPIDFAGLNFDAIIDVQADFFSFESQIAGREPLSLSERLLYKRTFNVSDGIIHFQCFNTAWLSRRNEVQSELFIPPQVLVNGSTNPALSVAMLHHPYNWLSADNYRAAKQFIEASSDLVLTGHEHVADAMRKKTFAGEELDYIEAPAFQDETGESGFQVIICDFDARQQQITRFRWVGDRYSEVDSREWELVRNTGRGRAQLRTSEAFLEDLRNVGTGFRHPRRTDLVLRDIYVYPDLRHRTLDSLLTEGAPKSVNVRAEELCDFVCKHKYLVMYGADDSGKTSLAKVLFEDLRARGLFPVLLHGEDLKGCKTADLLQRAVNRAISYQYSSEDIEPYGQLKASERALIVDDFHFARLTRATQVGTVRAMLTTFETIVILASDLFRMQEIARSNENANPFADFKHCDIKEFGRFHRHRLIERWLYLGREDSTEPEDLSRQVARVDKAIATLLGKNVLPHYPVVILSLLQLLESGESPNTANGSYGYLYEVLIKTSLAAEGTSDVDAKVTYMSGVAYAMLKAKQPSLSETEFRAAHNAYCQRYDMVRDFTKMSADLRRAEILVENNGRYRFKYPYIFYYAVAKYYQENAAALSTEILQIADHIYNETNANILIFYVYLTKDAELIRRLTENARKIYDEHPSCDLATHVEFVNRMYTEAPPPLQLTVDVRSNRDEFNRKQDEAEEKARELEPLQTEADDIVYDRQLQDVIKINIAFKTLQILGQVLRNFPGSLDGSLKFAITDQCYSLGMRTLRALLGIAETNLDQFRKYIAQLIAERTGLSDRQLADRTDMAIIWLTMAAAYGSIKRISYAVGHQDLTPTYEKVLKERGDLATQVIDVAVKLDHFDQVPETELRRLRQQVKDNRFTYSVVRDLVGDYLYLYSTDFPTVQMLGSMWDIRADSPKLLVNRAKKT